MAAFRVFSFRSLSFQRAYRTDDAATSAHFSIAGGRCSALGTTSAKSKFLCLTLMMNLDCGGSADGSFRVERQKHHLGIRTARA